MQENPKLGYIEWLSRIVTEWTGSSYAILSAVAVIVLWAVCGPFCNYSDTWQLIINTGTTIITFLMVFMIQRSQNKDSHAIHLKLNELIASSKSSNRLVNIENLSEEEILKLHERYSKLQDKNKPHAKHTIEEVADSQ